MAEIEKSSFPMLPEKSWWILRKKFKSSIPTEISSSYIQTVLNVSDISARTNIIPHLRILGLIDENNKPLPLSNRWRDDQEYPKVCKEIKDRIYPDELKSAIDDPESDRDNLVRWFMTKTGVGNIAAKKMARMYAILTIADHTKEQEIKISTKKQKSTPKKIKIDKNHKTESKSIDEAPKKIEEKRHDQAGDLSFPSIHINLQIHLSPETTTEQIEQIFASISKHLKHLNIK